MIARASFSLGVFVALTACTLQPPVVDAGDDDDDSDDA